MLHKSAIIRISIIVSLCIIAISSCNKEEPASPEKPPIAIDEPRIGTYSLQLNLAGDTDAFLMSGTLFAIPRYSKDSVSINTPDGDMLSENGIYSFSDIKNVNLKTSSNAILLQGHSTIVIRNLYDTPQHVNITLQLSYKDSLLYENNFEMSSTDISASLQFSSDSTKARFEVLK